MMICMDDTYPEILEVRFERHICLRVVAEDIISYTHFQSFITPNSNQTKMTGIQ